MTGQLPNFSVRRTGIVTHARVDVHPLEHGGCVLGMRAGYEHTQIELDRSSTHLLAEHLLAIAMGEPKGPPAEVVLGPLDKPEGT